MIYLSKAQYVFLLFFAIAGIVDFVFFIYVLSHIKIAKRKKE